MARKDPWAPVWCRYMRGSDLDPVLDIEEASYSKGMWGKADFDDYLVQETATGVVAEGIKSKRVLGFMLFTTGVSHYEIVDLAVDKSVRGCGVGYQLFHTLVSKLTANKRPIIMASMLINNKTATKFFERQGFKEIEKRRDKGLGRFKYEFLQNYKGRK